MEEIKRYLRHLPSCNIMQNWSEAEQAFADTPNEFRGPDWNEAYESMRQMKRTCTCGMEKIGNSYFPEAFIEWYVTEGQFDWKYGVGRSPNPLREAFEYWRKEFRK